MISDYSLTGGSSTMEEFSAVVASLGNHRCSLYGELGFLHPPHRTALLLQWCHRLQHLQGWSMWYHIHSDDSPWWKCKAWSEHIMIAHGLTFSRSLENWINTDARTIDHRNDKIWCQSINQSINQPHGWSWWSIVVVLPAGKLSSCFTFWVVLKGLSNFFNARKLERTYNRQISS